MLLAVGGESRRIILGEVPPPYLEQEQDSAQDVAAQCIQENNSIKKKNQCNEIETSVRHAENKDIEIFRENKKNVMNYLQMNMFDRCSISSDKRIRKLIPVDFDLQLDESEELNNENINLDTALENGNINKDLKVITYNSIIRQSNSHCQFKKKNQYYKKPWIINEGLRLTKNEYHRFCDMQLEAYDLATQCPTRKISDRNHKVNKNMISSLLSTNDYKENSTFESYSNQSEIMCSPKIKYNLEQTQQFNLKCFENKNTITKSRNFSDNSNSTSAKIISNNKNIYSCLGEIFLEDKLSLTLEEIVHIRSVLTKAELESFPAEGRVKEDVEKRRVCFLCLKTRFGFLGPWGQRCRLCQRMVCVKCYSKMKIPTDHFANVPVISLSPGSPNSPSIAESNFEISKSPWFKSTTINSAPTSPTTKRNIRRFFGSPSKFVNITTFGTIGKINKNQERDIEHIHGVLVVVCHDCRMMVIQIIKNTRISRAIIRNNVISRLTLDILPVYV